MTDREEHLAGGPLDMLDRNLIGFVCSKSEELGCGFEIYEFEVAPLTRAARAKLWAALEPVLQARVVRHTKLHLR